MESTKPEVRIGELDEIRTNLDKLRREMYAAETGTFARVAKWAGLIGLVISSALASTAIWDWLVTEKANRLAESIARVDGILIELAKANTVMAQIHPQSPQYQAVSQSINGIKIPLVDTAASIVKEMSKSERQLITSGALLALSYELGNQHRYQEAIDIANLSAENAKNRPIELEARRMSYGISFQSLDSKLISNGRSGYKLVISEASKIEGLAKYWILSNTIRDWAVGEGVVGNCAAVPDIIARFENSFNHPGAKSIATEGRNNTLQLLRARQLCQ